MTNRSTVQRNLVLEAVSSLRCHATAEAIYEYVVKRLPRISRGTVYRNLSVLTDLGKILRVEIPNAADRYDHQCHAHYHAHCVECGRVFDVDMVFLSDLSAHIKDRQGFAFQSHNIVFKGVCLECNTQKERKQST